MLKSFLVLFVLLIGIGVSVNLANNPQIFFSQAAFKPIEIIQQGCVKLQNNKLISTCDNVDLRLAYEYNSTPSPSASSNPSIAPTITPTTIPTTTPADDDLDNDGVKNSEDCAPTDPSKWKNASLYKDQDMDRFTSGSLQTVCIGNNIPDGWRDYDSKTTDVTLRVYLWEPYPGFEALLDQKLKGEDCYDQNRLAHPYPTSFETTGLLPRYTQNRGDGSFDYNCDGQERSYPDWSKWYSPNTLSPTRIFATTPSGHFINAFLPLSDPEAKEKDILNATVNGQPSTFNCGEAACPGGPCGQYVTFKPEASNGPLPAAGGYMMCF